MFRYIVLQRGKRRGTVRKELRMVTKIMKNETKKGSDNLQGPVAGHSCIRARVKELSIEF